jgi:hypothetical protein
MWIPLALSIFGLLGIAIEVVAAVSNKRALEGVSKWRRRCLSWPAISVGLLLAIASFWPQYSLGDRVRVAGVPFFTVILLFERGHWIDHVPMFVNLSVIGNAVFAALLPQPFILLARRVRQQALSRFKH